MTITPTAAPSDADLRQALDERLPIHRADLDDLVRIPSVSAPGFDADQVRRSADRVVQLLDASGLHRARLLEVDGAHPAATAELTDAGPDAPTVLLYAHHDVQPPGLETEWTTPPFEPAERDGRLFGRGTADDKAGVLVHTAAVDAWLQTVGAVPLNVKVVVEGEEETGSAHLPDFLERYAEELQADVIVVADSSNWRVGTPALTYLLRGLVDCEVRVSTLDHAVHSGMYGGPAPDALTTLCKVLSGLTDQHGAVAVPGFTDDVREPTPEERQRLQRLALDEDSWRREAGLLPGVHLTGNPHVSVLERLWMQPTATVIGIDAPSVADSSNTLVPRASARLSLRLAPGQDPHRAMEILTQYLRSTSPWGAHIEVVPGASAGAFVAEPDGPAFRAAERALSAAFDAEVVYQGVGGSIPFIEPFADAFGGAPALLTAVQDPDSRAHGVDESLHLGDWRRACLAETLLFRELATAMG